MQVMIQNLTKLALDILVLSHTPLLCLRLFNNRTRIFVNLGLFSGISSGETQNFDMTKSPLSFVDCCTASRGFGSNIPELLPDS